MGSLQKNISDLSIDDSWCNTQEIANKQSTNEIDEFFNDFQAKLWAKYGQTKLSTSIDIDPFETFD